VKPVSRDKLLTALRRFPRVVTAPHGSPKVRAIHAAPMATELIEAVLTPEGCTVLKAAGREADATLVQQERPALVVLNLRMPEVDGFTVVERLRADPATATLPIVILRSKRMTGEEKERLKG
jgi:CheY-like chemotaxis protein